MTKIPEPINTLSALIDKAHESKPDLPRPHMGASMIGHPCRRKLWLSFRWAVVEKFPGRILRLFRRGHHEEEWIVADLRAAGVEILEKDPDTGRQWLIKDGHFGGSLDGVALSGIPEAPNKPHVFEAKTHSLKSFKDMVKKGVKESKPIHWAQVQIYMAGLDIDRALYFAVCKDTDEIYTERVELKKTEAKELNEKAQSIIASDRMPEPLSADPSWFECKFCSSHDLCFGSKTTKEVNCRTCAHSTAKRDGTWHCGRWNSEIPAVEFQRAGCEDHVMHPDLVPWTLVGGDGTSADYSHNGKEFRNGAGGFKSRELLANFDGCMDQGAQAIRQKFDGEIKC